MDGVEYRLLRFKKSLCLPCLNPHDRTIRLCDFVVRIERANALTLSRGVSGALRLTPEAPREFIGLIIF